MSARKLSVVVCTHKRPDGLARLLETLVPQVAHHPDRELIVVNDGTHDAEYADVIGRFADLVRYEALPNPVGIARARNRSAELARGDFLVFTDDDCEVPPHWLDWISATLAAHPELDVVAGTTKPLRLEEAGLLGHVQSHFQLLPKPHALGTLDQSYVTACLAVRHDLFRELGGFDERPLFAMGGEDTNLSLRLIRARARTRIDPDWHVLHALSTDLLAEMRRYARYGYTTVMPDDRQSRSRPNLVRRYLEHFRNARRKAQDLPGGFFYRIASAFAASAILTSYDWGAARRMSARRQRG